MAFSFPTAPDDGATYQPLSSLKYTFKNGGWRGNLITSGSSGSGGSISTLPFTLADGTEKTITLSAGCVPFVTTEGSVAFVKVV